MRERNGFFGGDLSLPASLKKALTGELLSEIETLAPKIAVGGGRIEEIRLRGGRRTAIITHAGGGKRSLFLEKKTSEEELCSLLSRFCDGSLYAYSEAIIGGCVTLEDGVRVGVCGRARVENGKIIGVYGVSALNVRIPDARIFCASELAYAVKKKALEGEGTLIFSPPSVGKTSCLRAISYSLAYGEEGMRIALVDTRDELSLLPDCELLSVDILRGYPKSEGIRIATLFMNPELIVCDEIGSLAEARTILETQNCGVPLLASAHASDISSLMRRPAIAELHRAKIFGSYLSLGRSALGGGFTFKLYSWEDAENVFKDSGRAFAYN